MNRKELTRAYKDSRRPAGIYAVRNVANGRILVGRSLDLPAILNRERTQLKLGAHPNKVMQRDWDECGADAFVFEVLDTLTAPDDDPAYDPAHDLEILEALWREKLRLAPRDDASALGEEEERDYTRLRRSVNAGRGR